MKVKIVNALKTAYANLGLSEKALDGVAAFLEKTIKEESEIDAAIKEASVANLLKVYQSELDSERGKASKAAKDLEELKKSLNKGNDKPDVEKEEESELMTLLKSMKADNEALKARLDKQENDARNASVLKEVRETLIRGKRDRSGLLNIILANQSVGADDTVETLVKKYEGIYDAQYKELYGDGITPFYGGGSHVETDDKDPFGNVANALKSKGYLPTKKD